MLEASFNTMAASLERSQAELERYAEDQAALRRVATLVARDVAPAELLRERGARGDRRARLGLDRPAPLRAETAASPRWRMDGIAALGPSRSKGSSSREGAGHWAVRLRRTATTARRDPLRARPIFVGGRLWGVMVTAWARERPRPDGVEARMAEFTELVATAIANAESRAELAASRARVVAAADETRRRIERDLHDGTQQRLVTLGLGYERPRRSRRRRGPS